MTLHQKNRKALKKFKKWLQKKRERENSMSVLPELETEEKLEESVEEEISSETK